MTLVLTKELGERIEQSEIDALSSRLIAIKEMDQNPMGVEVQKFGSATAFSVRNIPGPSFNTVKGLRVADDIYIDEIIDFYKMKGIPVRFELTPAHASPDLLSSLNQKGFYQSDFHASLYTSGKTVSMEGIDSSISIRELNRDEFDTFADIYTKGFQMPDFLKSGVAQNNEILHGDEHWTFYLASIENEPAGIGVLFVKDGIANLAAAATLPSLRGKGIQSALIKQRMQQAYLDGCELIVGQAKFGSVSQTNMQRAGMGVAYTKAIWVER